jgi:hypothetical protein
MALEVFPPDLSKRGVGSDIPLGKAWTIDKENFSSHSVVNKIRSSFSNVGTVMLFAQVYFLPDILSSLRLRPSIIALNQCSL